MEPLDPELRRIIREGLREAAPGPEIEARSLARLLSRLPAEAPGPEPGVDPTPLAAAAKTSALTGGIKALIVAATITGGGVTIAALTRDPTPTIVEPTPTREPPIVAPPIVTPAIAPPPPRPARAPRPAPDALLAETRAIAEADAALADDRPELARTLARKIAREHPDGQLKLERLAIEISARCGLAEPDAAAAAREFLREHADTAVASKVRTRCADLLR